MNANWSIERLCLFTLSVQRQLVILWTDAEPEIYLYSAFNALLQMSHIHPEIGKCIELGERRQFCLSIVKSVSNALAHPSKLCSVAIHLAISATA